MIEWLERLFEDYGPAWVIIFFLVLINSEYIISLPLLCCSSTPQRHNYLSLYLCFCSLKAVWDLVLDKLGVLCQLEGQRVKERKEKRGQTDKGGNLHSVRHLSAEPSLNCTYQHDCRWAVLLAKSISLPENTSNGDLRRREGRKEGR